MLRLRRMLRVKVVRSKMQEVINSLHFYSYEEETNFLSLFIRNDNTVEVIFHFWMVWDKKELVDDYSLLLILINKALKVIKKDYPERYEIVKQNFERLKSQIL